ncbi:MAG TPA: hypothetical protein VLD57_02705 [Blastocatellia bacterium]|nr:hypothetical protein [Blastocatellia bacterium]
MKNCLDGHAMLCRTSWLRLLSTILLIATLAGASLGSSFIQELAGSKGSGRITGRVTVNGKPAPGIIVLASPSDAGDHSIQALEKVSPFKSSTDQEGLYRLTGLPAGRYEVAVFTPTYVNESREDDHGKVVTLSEGDVVEGIDFSLGQGAVITGTVTDSSGRPLIREYIKLTFVTELDKNQQSSFEAEDDNMFYTDDRGVYRIYGIPPGRYLVSAGEPGGRAAYTPFFSPRTTRPTFHPGVTEEGKAKILDVEAGEELTGIDIKVAPAGKGYAASGRIIYSNGGRPVPDTMIYYTRINEGYRGAGQPATAFSNSKGEFRLEDLQPGNYMAGAFFSTESEYYSENVSFDIASGDLAGLEIRLSRGGSIEGVIMVEEGTDTQSSEPLAGLTIMANVANPERGLFSFGRGKINPDGSFRVSGLAPGKAHIMVADHLRGNQLRVLRIERDGAEQQEGITIGAGERITGVRIILGTAGVSIRGRVIFEGGKLPEGTNLIVIAHPPNKARLGPRTSMAEVQPDGSFVIESLTLGDFELEFITISKDETRDGFSLPALWKQTVTVSSKAPVEISVTINLKDHD